MLYAKQGDNLYKLKKKPSYQSKDFRVLAPNMNMLYSNKEIIFTNLYAELA